MTCSEGIQLLMPVHTERLTLIGHVLSGMYSCLHLQPGCKPSWSDFTAVTHIASTVLLMTVQTELLILFMCLRSDVYLHLLLPLGCKSSGFAPQPPQ